MNTHALTSMSIEQDYTKPERRKVHSIIHQRPVALAVARKVGHQFPRTPEGALFHGIFRQALLDLFTPAHRYSACRHLQGRIYEAELCGIDSDWIRLQLKRAGISLEDHAL